MLAYVRLLHATANVGKKLGRKGNRYAEAQKQKALRHGLGSAQLQTPLLTAGGPLQQVEEQLTWLWQEKTQQLQKVVELEMRKVAEAGRQAIATELMTLQGTLEAAGSVNDGHVRRPPAEDLPPLKLPPGIAISEH